MTGERFTRYLLLGLIVVVAGLGVFASYQLDRLDSALFFVGLPSLLAVAVAYLPTRGEGWATVFQVTTVVLLVVSAVLHEGALCVLIASPLVYATVGAVYLTVSAYDGSSHRVAVLPLLAVLALEGAVPGLRVNADQQSATSRIVAPTCAEFAAALDRGPRIDADADRGLLLRLAQYPTPVAATGSGLAQGDTWTLRMPAGAISTEVVARTETPDSGRLDFAVTEDTARTTRWVGLRAGSLEWAQTGDGCRAELAVDYTRKLDPSFWFGPVTDLFMGAGAAAFLASLD